MIPEKTAINLFFGLYHERNNAVMKFIFEYFNCFSKKKKFGKEMLLQETEAKEEYYQKVKKGK